MIKYAYCATEVDFFPPCEFILFAEHICPQKPCSCFIFEKQMLFWAKFTVCENLVSCKRLQFLVLSRSSIFMVHIGVQVYYFLHYCKRYCFFKQDHLEPEINVIY